MFAELFSMLSGLLRFVLGIAPTQNFPPPLNAEEEKKYFLAMDYYAFGLAVNHNSCYFLQPAKGPNVVITDKKVYFNALACEFAECL